jgi:large subunit ribosomal protein L17
MRHRRAGRKLNRNAAHRLSLFRNLSRALITHERITTTVAKAMSRRPFVEGLTPWARGAAAANDGSPAGKARALHLRRQAMARLGPIHGTGIYDKKGEPVEVNDTVLKKLFNDIGPRFTDRPGGYTRVLKLHERRLGDAGEQAIIELLRVGESKPKKERPAAAPAPATAN